MKAVTQKINRRGFLKAGAASTGGLLLGFYLPERHKLAAQTAATDAKLNAFVHIGSDDSVTLFLHKSEMGQGVVTSLSQLLGEELECDWKKIRTEFPGINRERVEPERRVPVIVFVLALIVCAGVTGCLGLYFGLDLACSSPTSGNLCGLWAFLVTGPILMAVGIFLVGLAVFSVEPKGDSKGAAPKT